MQIAISQAMLHERVFRALKIGSSFDSIKLHIVLATVNALGNYFEYIPQEHGHISESAYERYDARLFY